MKVVIVDYNPLWPVTFLKEKHIIESALKDINPVIEHVGSTSVPGLAAKPVIDILAGVESEEQLALVVGPMIDSGYVYFKKYEPAMPYRRYFVRLNVVSGKPIPEIIDVNDDYIAGNNFISVTHIHLMVKDTYHFNRHIAFRDYLKAHADVRDEYDALKRTLALQEFKDGLAYNDAKDSFVKHVERNAMRWKELQREC